MLSLKNKLQGQGQANNTVLLHGSDVAEKKSVTIHVLKAREAPLSFNAAMILDIDPIKCGKITAAAWAVNKTNARMLGDILFPGEDDPNYELLEGMDIILDIIPQNNPRTNEMVPSLFVSKENAPKIKRGRK